MQTRVLITHVLHTFGASALSVLTLVASGALIARMLGVEDRGAVAAAVLLPTIVAFTGEIGLPVATGYFMRARLEQRSRTLATACTLALILSVVLTLLAAVLISLLPFTPAVRQLGYIFLPFIPLNIFQRIYLAILQADLRMRAFNTVRISGSIAYLIIIIALYVTGTGNTVAVIIAQLIGNVVFLCLPFVLLKTRPRFAFDISAARSLLSYGTRAQLGNVPLVDHLRVDQLILALLLPAYDLGLYVAAMTFVMANRSIGTSVGMVVYPLAMRRRETPGSTRVRQLVALVGGASLAAVLLAGIEMIWGGELLTVLFGAEFAEAATALSILAVASIFMNARQIIASWLRGTGRPGIPSLAEITSLVLLIVLARLFWNGHVTGVAWAVTFSSAGALLATCAPWLLRVLRQTPIRLPSLHPKQAATRILPILLLLPPTALGLLSARLPATVSLALIAATIALILFAHLLTRWGLRVVTSLALFAAAATFGMNGLRPAGWLTITDIFLLIAAFSLIPQVGQWPTAQLAGLRLQTAGVLLISLGGLSGALLSASDPRAATLNLLRFVIAASLVAVIFVLWSPSKRDILLITWLWVFSATISGIVGIIGGLNGPYRPYGLTTHPNHLALVSALALGPAFALALISGKLWRVFSLCCCAVLCMSVIISGSRSGMITAAALVILMLFFTRRIVLASWLTCGVIGMIVALSLSPLDLPQSNAIQRLFFTEERSTVAANVERKIALEQTLDDLRSHPVTGIGFVGPLTAHNIYLHLWLSAGVLGLIGITLIVVATLRPLQSYLLSNGSAIDHSSMTILLGFLASFVAFLLSGWFQPALWDRYIWLTPAIIIVLAPYAWSYEAGVADRKSLEGQAGRLFPLQPRGAIVRYGVDRA